VTSLPAHQQLERKIERIHRLLEVEGSIVTWNERIPDPDNPNQLRQIDVTIRRDSCLTLIECRLHKTPQDVNWIEELIGRRISLKADAVIAVSTSGFTKTARAKAARHGIHLRDFASLSSEEIQNWGRKRTLRLAFCEFTHVIVTIRVKESSGAAKPNLTDVEFQPVSPLLWRMLFQSIMHRLDEQKWSGVPVTIDSEVGANLLINGKPPVSIMMSTKVRRITEMVSLASVFEYADPSTEAKHAEFATFTASFLRVVTDFSFRTSFQRLTAIRLSSFRSIWSGYSRDLLLGRRSLHLAPGSDIAVSGSILSSFLST
jgi:Restriction endonuclease